MSVRLPKSLAAYRALTRAATPLAQQLLNYRLRHGKEHPTRMARVPAQSAGRTVVPPPSDRRG